MRKAPFAAASSILILLVLALGGAACWGMRPSASAAPVEPEDFDGQRAMRSVEYQVSLGPRLPESEAHAQTVDWIEKQLKSHGWETEIQTAERMGHPIRNVVGRYGEGRPWVVLGAHYDSRMLADNDPDFENRNKPVPGANDGASGVAVLLELARVLPEHLEEAGLENVPYGQIWLVFFDAEDNGRIPGWDWILGSRAFVEGLDEHPDAAVIVDMIGDADLNIYQENNSDRALTEEIWKVAAEAGYGEQFIPTPKYTIHDDHIPFLEAGIPAADLIDFDYPYWHTIEDTPDKVAPESLKAVGDTLLAWLTGPSEPEQTSMHYFFVIVGR